MSEINLISSRDNTKLKRVRGIRDGHDSNQIFLEGVRLVEESLRSGSDINQVFVEQNFAQKPRNRELVERLLAASIDIYEVASNIFPSLSDTDHPQGIVMTAKRPPTGRELVERRLQSFPSHVVLMLHEINNPSNLGAILRSAEAAGVAGVVTTERSANVFSPKTSRAAMGSNLRLPIWEGAVDREILAWAKQAGLVTTAADIKGGSPYYDIDWKKPRLLIFGSEAHGIQYGILNSVEESIYIPMKNDVESLNLAVSTGIILFEAARSAAR